MSKTDSEVDCILGIAPHRSYTPESLKNKAKSKLSKLSIEKKVIPLRHFGFVTPRWYKR